MSQPLFAQGTLSLGTPKVDGANVTIPVLLEGNVGEGVAALDFTLRYDPAVLAPTGVRAGDAATTAGKGVQYNRTAPGNYVVMMFGLNQTTIQSGKVADIALRKLSASANSSTDIAITGTTLASLAGDTIASNGSTKTVDLTGKTEEDPEPEEPTDPADPTDPEEPDPTTSPDDPTDSPTDPGTPTGTPGTSSGGLPSGPGSGTGTTNSPSPGHITPMGSPLSRSVDGAASGLAQLNRMAKELDRKRSQLPTPGGSATAEGDAGETSGSSTGDAAQGRTPGTGLPPGGLPQGEKPAPNARTEVALLAPKALGNESTPDAAVQITPPETSGKVGMGRAELWLIAGLAALFGIGFFLRRRLFS